MQTTLLGRFLLLCLLAALVTGCTGRGYNLKNLAKSDINMVTDTHIRELRVLTEELLIKLYKRNPVQLSRGRVDSIEDRIAQLFAPNTDYRFPELDNQRGNAALVLAFEEDFQGDRVFALMVGIKSTLHASYNGNTEMFMLRDLDQQKLYESARNLETINWRLNNRRDSLGEPFLLSNGYEEGIANFSFERLFGKMIVLQDMMAKIVADRNNRAINSVIHSVASTTLFPIGI